MDPELISIIKQAGLSTPQSKVYYSLLKTKESTMTQVANLSGFKRPNTYEIISSLKQLGLISSVKKGRRNYYSAVHPRRLLQLASFKEKQIRDHLPKLVGAYSGSGQKPQVQMFEGLEAVRAVYKEAFQRLQDGEELLIFTNIGRVLEKFPEVPKEFANIMGSILYKSKARELTYGDQAGINYAKQINSKTRQDYEVRLTPPSLPFGDNEQFIFEDKIIYFSLQKNIFVVVIENQDLAITQKTMFELAWSNAQTTK
jgi:DNA-binding MarR family transcriptional regulator